MKRKKIYYNEEKNVDELKKKHQEGPAATPAPPGKGLDFSLNPILFK